MFYQELPMGITICFCEGSKQVGKQRRYTDPDRIYDILRAAHCQQEDHHAVAEALRHAEPVRHRKDDLVVST